MVKADLELLSKKDGANRDTLQGGGPGANFPPSVLLWCFPWAEPTQEPNQKPVRQKDSIQVTTQVPSKDRRREIPSGRGRGRRPVEAARRRLGSQDHSNTSVPQ